MPKLTFPSPPTAPLKPHKTTLSAQIDPGAQLALSEFCKHFGIPKGRAIEAAIKIAMPILQKRYTQEREEQQAQWERHAIERAQAETARAKHREQVLARLQKELPQTDSAPEQ